MKYTQKNWRNWLVVTTIFLVVVLVFPLLPIGSLWHKYKGPLETVLRRPEAVYERLVDESTEDLQAQSQTGSSPQTGTSSGSPSVENKIASLDEAYDAQPGLERAIKVDDKGISFDIYQPGHYLYIDLREDGTKFVVRDHETDVLTVDNDKNIITHYGSTLDIRGSLKAGGSTGDRNQVLTAQGEGQPPIWQDVGEITKDGLGCQDCIDQDEIKDLYVLNTGDTMSGDLQLDSQKDLRFADSDSSHFVALQAPATISSNITWTLPSSDGTSGQVLSTDGSGVLSWATGGGGSFSSFTLSDGTNTQTITDGNTLTVAAGTDIDTTVSATDTVTIALESTLDGVSTINLSGTGTLNGLDAIDSTSETTLEATLDIAGDVSGTGLGSVVIGADKVLESHVKAVDAASDEECLTYESTGGDFEWQSCGSGGSMSSFTVAGSAGDNQTITDGNTLTIAAGTGITTTGGATDTVTIASTLGTSIANSEIDADTIDWDRIVDASALDAATSVTGTAGETFTFTRSLTDATTENGLILNVTAADTTSGTAAQYGFYLDNLASTEGLDAALVIDNSDTDDAVAAGIKFIDAGGGFTALIDNAGTLISGAELNRLDGKDAALVDTNDAVATAIIGTGALNSGSITSGFGSIDLGADTITTTGAISTDTLTLTNTGTLNGLDAIDSTGETTLEATLDIAGDVSGTGLGSVTIGADKVLESHLKAVDAAGDEECLTYESTTGDFEWESCTETGASLFTLAGSAGTNQTITAGDTVTIGAGTGITTTGAATDTVTIAATLGTSIAGSEVDDDTLDFVDFEDTLDIDAALTINSTDTTADGFTYTATSLTTGTAFDINATNTATTNTAIQQIEFDLTNAQGTAANTDFAGFTVDFTNNPTVAGNTETAARIRAIATSNTTDNAIAALLILDNADTSTAGSTVVTDALRIVNTGDIAGGITNAINIDDTDVTNDIVLQNDEVIQNDADGTIAFTDGTNTLASIVDDGTSGTLNVTVVTLTNTGTLNGLDAIDATGETTLEAALDIAGDISGTGLTAVTIGADKVLESHLKAVDAASDEECLTYETTTGDFEWQVCSTAATTTLSEAYGNDADGSDAVITLTTGDDSIEIDNPAASGTDSAFAFFIDQNDTTGVDAFTIDSESTDSNAILITHAGDGTDNAAAAAISITAESGAGGLFVQRNLGAGDDDPLVEILSDHASGDQAALFIDNDAIAGIALDIDADNTTGDVTTIDANALTTGDILQLASTSTVVTSGELLNIDLASSGDLADKSGNVASVAGSRTETTGITSDDYDLFALTRTNINDGLAAQLTTAGAVLRIENVATQTQGTLTDTVKGIELVMDADGSGNAIFIDSNGTATTSQIALNIDSESTTADVIAIDATLLTTGDGVQITVDNSMTTGKALRILGGASGTTEVFNVDDDGATTIGGDITWTAATPNITLNAAETLTIGPSGGDTFTINASGSLFSFSDGTNSFSFDVDSGPTYAGTARPTRKVTLSPEFPGASLTGDGGSNTGTMTSDFCENGVSADIPQTNTGVCNTAADIHNYYSWTTGEGTAQDYDVWIRWRVPDNFAAWAASNPVNVYGKRTDTTNNAVTVYVYDTAGTLENASGTQVAGTTWTQTSVESSFGGTYTAGSYMTIRIAMTADTGGDSVQVGEISLDYLTNN